MPGSRPTCTTGKVGRNLVFTQGNIWQAKDSRRGEVGAISASAAMLAVLPT